MGAYDNPTILRDTSLGVLGKAVDTLNKTLGIAYQSAEKRRLARQAATNKEKMRVQGISFKIKTEQWKNANKNIDLYKEGEGDLFGEYQNNVTWLLNGKGVYGQEGYELGAIEASTLLASRAGLSAEQETYYNSVIARSNSYQRNALSGAGAVISDLEDFDGVTSTEMNNTHYWAGDTVLEQDTSMLTTYGLKGYTVDGLTSTKESIVGENGAGLIKVTSKVDPDSDLFGRLSKTTQEKLAKQNYTLTWEKDASLWKQGLIRKISKTIDVDKTTTEADITNKDGDLKDDYYSGQAGDNSQVNVKELIGDGKVNDVQYKILDKTAILENSVIKLNIETTAARLVGGNQSLEGDFQAAMQNTLRMGNNDWNIDALDINGKAIIVNNFTEFRDLSSEQQEKILINELQEQYLEEAVDSQQKLFKDLDKKVQEFIVKNNNGVKPDDDEVIFYDRSKDNITNLTKDSDFTYQTVAFDKLKALPKLSPTIDSKTGKRTEMTDGYDKYDEAQAKIHERFLEKNFPGLDIATEEIAFAANKKEINRALIAGEINPDTGVPWTEAGAIREIGVQSKTPGLYVLVGKRYKRQNSYDSYDNNTLAGIIGEYAKGYTNDASFKNWTNMRAREEAKNKR